MSVKGDGRELVTAKEAGRRLGISAQAVGQWGMRPGAPVELAGGVRRYVWPDFPRWREGELTKRPAPSDLDESRKRREAAEARLAELKVDAEERRLIPVDEAAEAVGEMLAQLRSQLLTLPQRWAPQVVGLTSLPQATTVLDEAVAEAMRALQAAA